MELSALDMVVFVVFLLAVVAIGLWKSRGEASSEDYFLAGRGLTWPLIGFSLIAANISAESFVGMSGAAARPGVGLAIGSYDWIASITLVAVAFWFLPTFLRSGIFTIPQFLEYRFDSTARTITSLLMVGIYVFVTITAVIYMGAKAFEPLFNNSVNIAQLSWMVGIAAAIYVFAGGLKACAWADLIQGAALILGGAAVTALAFLALNNPDAYEGTSAAVVNRALGVGDGASLGEKFAVLKREKMHMVLPAASDVLPWTALLLGIWIPNLYYWGFNQYIIQRTLGSKSLAQGQKGVVFAAAMKLVMPFIVCFPGIVAFALYHEKMADDAMTSPQLNAPVLAQYAAARADSSAAPVLIPFDADFAKLHPELAAEILAFNAASVDGAPQTGLPTAETNAALLATAIAQRPDLAERKTQMLVGYDYDGAFPLLVRYLTPTGLRGFVVAALMGAVISSLASMLNAASTIFTMDIWREWVNRNASQKQLIWVGRTCVPIAVAIGCAIAPQLAKPEFKGAFNFIQEFQGFVSPGLLTIFLFGLWSPRTPRICGTLGLVLSPIIYGVLYLGFGNVAFLNRQAITVAAIAAVLAIATVAAPLREPVVLPQQSTIAVESSPRARTLGIAVCIVTVALYVFFW